MSNIQNLMGLPFPGSYFEVQPVTDDLHRPSCVVNVTNMNVIYVHEWCTFHENKFTKKFGRPAQELDPATMDQAWQSIMSYLQGFGFTEFKQITFQRWAV